LQSTEHALVRRHGLRLIQPDQDLAQLDSPVCLKHDALTACEGNAALGPCPEPPYVPHQTVAYEVHRLARLQSPRPAIAQNSRQLPYGFALVWVLIRNKAAPRHKIAPAV
jgi:hypothetical protein